MDILIVLLVELLNIPIYVYKCLTMYIKSTCWRCYVSMALVNFSHIRWNDRASAELEQGKKRNLVGTTAGNPAVHPARSWPDTWPDRQGKLRIFVLVTALNPSRYPADDPAKSWPDSDVASVLVTFHWNV